MKKDEIMNEKIAKAIKPVSASAVATADDAHENRYVWFALHRLRMDVAPATQPMSISDIEPRVLTLIQDVVYWGRDESDEMLDPRVNPSDTPTLKKRICTAKEQESFLQSRYGSRGLVSVQALVGVAPEEVADFQARLFDGFDAWEDAPLSALLNYLESFRARSERERLALAEITAGTRISIDWANAYLNNAEKEIQDSFAGKAARGTLSDFEHLLYEALGRPKPIERTLEYQGTSKGDETSRALAMIAEALNKLSSEKSKK